MIKTKQYIKFIIFICIVILILLFSQGCSEMTETTAHLVKVMVAVPGGAVLESENPIYIDSGGTAQFKLTIKEGLKLENIETIDSEINGLTEKGGSCGAFYEDGILYLENVF